ncbi:MAG: MMPL family transporter, partial [Crenarchaeota archaeon]|nr:MMPL family transporter [Thermoproteota archaeon]
MGVVDTIVKHAGIILVIWIIIALISAPATTNLNKITEYNAQRMLPNGTEAIQANNLLAKIRGSTANGMAAIAYDVILVSGINTNDTGLLKWDNKFHEKVEPYVKDYVSPYRVANKAIKEIMPKINSTAEKIYKGVNMSYTMLSQLYSNRYQIIHGIKSLSRQLHMLKNTADQLYGNRTTIKKKASQLLSNLTMIKKAYNMSCIGYNESIQGLEKLLEYYPMIKKALVMGDTLYHELYIEEPRLYSTMTMLNKTITGLNKLYYNMSTTYDIVAFNTIRIYYLLRTHTTAFTKGLTPTDIAIVLNLTSNVPPKPSPEIIAATYYAIIKTYPDPLNISLRDLYTLSAEILVQQASQHLPPEMREPVKLFINTYSANLYNYTTAILREENITDLLPLYTVVPEKAQLLTIKTIMDAHGKALPVSVEIFAKEYANLLVEAGMINKEEEPVIITAAIEAYKLGENPGQELIAETVIGIMEQVMIKQTQGKIPAEAVKSYLEALYREGPTLEPAVKALNTAFNTSSMIPANMSKTIVETILAYDPHAEGNIMYNPYTAYKAAVTILSRISGLPTTIIEQVVTLGEDYIPVIAENLLEKGLEEKIGSKTIATAIAEIVAETNGVSTLKGYIALVTKILENTKASAMLSMIPSPLLKYILVSTWYGNITDTMLWKILLGTPIAYIAYEKASIESPTKLIQLINMSAIVNSIINNTYPENPDKYVVNDALMLEKILGVKTRFPGISTGKIDQEKLMLKILEYPENLTAKDIALILYSTFSGLIPSSETSGFNKTIVKDMIIKVLADDEPPKQVIIEETLSQLPSNISRTEIEVAIIEAIDKKSANPIFNALMTQINQTVLNKVLKAFNKTLISPDGRSFIILIDPRGNGLDQLYSNAVQAEKTANTTLWNMGYIPSYIGVTGDHVLVKEMKQASEKDIATVNRVSMIAPFIIALIIIGGIIAAGLPFIGIGMAILLSLAIIYVLGSIRVISVTSWSRMLMITTAFGLGMDYSSYIVLRFKEEIARRDKREAAKIAIKQTLPAIMAAASTDIIGFAVMLLAWDFPLLSSIGQTIPFAVVAVLLVSLTLTPALLALFGDKKWFWWPHRPEKGGAHWGGFKITKRRAV